MVKQLTIFVALSWGVSCTFSPSVFESGDSTTGVDGDGGLPGPGPDGSTVTSDCDKWTPLGLQGCGIPPTSSAEIKLEPGATDKSYWRLNTDTLTLISPDDVSVDVDMEHVSLVDGTMVARWLVSALELREHSFLAVDGSMPLVVVSHGTIKLKGFIGAGSNRYNDDAPGADGAHCSGASAGGEPSGAGGGGGALAADGGSGGSRVNAAGGAGGSAAFPQTIAGGCRGADGSGSERGQGGAGGGALHLASADQVLIEEHGGADVSGAGGDGGAGSSSGGGGGGSGGTLLLDAPKIHFKKESVATANGGWGGQGSGSGPNTSGIRGPDGVFAPQGGPDWSMTAGGRGGAGGRAGALLGGAGDDHGDGAGGGGGSAGRIIAHTDMLVTDSGAYSSPSTEQR